MKSISYKLKIIKLLAIVNHQIYGFTQLKINNQPTIINDVKNNGC